MATDQTKITFYLPPDLDAAFRARVALEDRKMTTVLNRLIKDYLATTYVKLEDTSGHMMGTEAAA